MTLIGASTPRAAGPAYHRRSARPARRPGRDVRDHVGGLGCSWRCSWSAAPSASWSPARRRELGLLRLVGATPRQVRRLRARRVGRRRRGRDHHRRAVCSARRWPRRCSGWCGPSGSPPRPAGPEPVDRLGGRRAYRCRWSRSSGPGGPRARAARIAPIAALREAAIERTPARASCSGSSRPVLPRRPGRPPWSRRATCRRCSRWSPPILLPEVVVIGLMCVGPAVIPRLAALLARPFIGRDVPARIARDEVRAAARTTAAVAAPVVAISAIAGSLLLPSASPPTGRPRRTGPGCTRRSSSRRTTRPRSRRSRPTRPSRLPTYAGRPCSSATRTAAPADATRSRSSTPPPRPPPGACAPPAAPSTTSTDARSRSPRPGSPTPASAWAAPCPRLDRRQAGRRCGSSPSSPTRPTCTATSLIPAGLLPPASDRATGTVFVVPRADAPRPRSRRRTLAGTGSRCSTADDWIDAPRRRPAGPTTSASTILLGPAGLYAAIAIVNATLIGASQRRRQNRLVAPPRRHPRPGHGEPPSGRPASPAAPGCSSAAPPPR